MLHRSIVVGWVVTPTSLFALPGLFYWQPTARLFWYRVVLFLPPVESAQGARWAHLGCVKDQKPVREPIHGNCNTRPICFISCAAWVNLPQNQPFLTFHQQVYGGRDQSGADCYGWFGAVFGGSREVWESGMGGMENQAGHHTGDLPTLYTHYQIPIPWKLSLKMPAFGNVTSSGTPWTKVH